MCVKAVQRRNQGGQQPERLGLTQPGQFARRENLENSIETPHSTVSSILEPVRATRVDVRILPLGVAPGRYQRWIESVVADQIPEPTTVKFW